MEMNKMINNNANILRIDLSKGEIKTEILEENIYRKYLGGSALASYFILKELEKGIDPLGPENILVFACGVITGTTVPGASRFTVAAKSPLTGGIGEAEAGGWFAPELKWAGYDAIVFKGVSPKPVYLWIDNDKVELRDATHLTGKEIQETEDIIRTELKDNRIRIAQTGPAGEKLIRFSCIINEGKHANGRSGLGAVMGSKKLRAVAVRGTHKKNDKAGYYNREKIKEITKKIAKNWKVLGEGRYLYGTAGGVEGLNAAGILPTRNFQEGQFEGASAISGQRMAESILVRRGNCYACPVKCKREVRVEGKYSSDPYYGGPEYETIGSLGSLCGIDNLEAIAKGNELCNKYCLDTIATGNVIAFAMECFEKGIINRKDTGGIDLKFGNADAMLSMIEKILHLEGIGAILAKGVKQAAKEFGNGAEKYAMHTKGQEIPMHEPRGKVTLALQYALSPTGGDHVEMFHDVAFADFGPALKTVEPLGILEPVDVFDLGPKKVAVAIKMQQVCDLYNCVGLCNFIPAPIGTLSFRDLTELIEAITGWNTSLYELLKVGERGNNMLRCFNIREGFSMEDDQIPDRFFERFDSGPLKDKIINKDDFKQAIKTYYTMKGWSEEGIPTELKLAELDLEWIDF